MSFCSGLMRILQRANRSNKEITVFLISIFLGLASSSFAYAEECSAYFSDGLQVHHKRGKIQFAWDAQLLNNPDNLLPAKDIKSQYWSYNKSCENKHCLPTGTATPRLNIDEFQTSDSEIDIEVPWSGSIEIDNTYVSDLRHVTVAPFGDLTIQQAGQHYHIKTLTLEFGSTLTLPPGDYWVQKLKTSGLVKIRTKGEGTVRLFVKSKVDFAWSTKINIPAGDENVQADHFFLYSADSVRISPFSEVAGFIYANKNARISEFSALYGALNAKNIKLGAFSSTFFLNEDLDQTNFAGLCSNDAIPDLDNDGIPDGLDNDIDGDGFLNSVELQVGTDPYDPEDVPIDENGNGIPDELEETANACIGTFPDGIQSYSDSGFIKFDYNARVLEGIGYGLLTTELNQNMGSSLASCGALSCYAAGYTVAQFGEPNFISSTLPGALEIDTNTSVVLGDDNVTEYPLIKVNANAQLRFSNINAEYIMSGLSVTTGGQVFLPAGNYWIGSLDIGSNAAINVLGEGTVRLFVQGDINIASSSLLNSPALGTEGNAYQLLMYGYANITIGSESTVSGLLFAKNKLELESKAKVFGALTAKDTQLKSESRVYYRLNDVENLDFGLLCDIDSDGIYDGIDEDRDGDGYSNEDEELYGTDPDDPNSKPSNDIDGDGIPDDSDPDMDGDGVLNEEDAFPEDASETSDIDGDGIGDNSDSDRDGDGISNDYETQLGTNPNDPLDTPLDSDGDAIPDAVDEDRDGDGVLNNQDLFPDDPNESADMDGDGIGDNADTDRDGDGISNDHETQVGTDPNDATSKPSDIDNDGIPDALDDDRDGDGVGNELDRFPDNANEWSDLDNDGVGDNSDPDRDGDGVLNINDAFPNDSSESSDLDGDGIGDNSDNDRDGDGVANNDDAFPEDTTETSDIDGDGIGDNTDPDRDGDNFTNDEELSAGTDPNSAQDYPDTVAPVLTLTTSSQSTESANIMLTGTAIDPTQPHSGIEGIKVTTDRYPNVSFTGELSGNIFTIDVPLKVELNQLFVYVNDVSGNESKAELVIDRESPPRFSNVTPIDGALVTEDNVSISGEVLTFLPLSDVSFFVNEWQITPTGSAEEGRYTFDLTNIPLTYGNNLFNLRVVTSDGTDTTALNVTYNPENADDIAAPTVEILSPVDGQLLNQRTFRLASRITSEGGAVLVTVNGNPIPNLSSRRSSHDFSTLVSFPENADTLDVTVSAIDSLGKETIKTAHYKFDDAGPVISLDQTLLSSPNINPVIESPFVISGTVSDANLASFLVNDQSVDVVPGSQAGSYAFSFSTALPFGSTIPIHINAIDFSGNQTQVEYQLESQAQAGLNIVLPADNSEFISQGSPVSVQTVVRTQGLTASDSVFAQVDNGAEVTLDKVADLVSGDVIFPAEAGQYTLLIGVRNEQGSLVAQTQRSIGIAAENDVDIALLRQEPESGQNHVEINAPVELYFNRQIDLAKLSVSVRETLYGYTYINTDPLGLDFLNAKGYQLEDVQRDLDMVNGQLDLLPGGTSVAFYPERSFGFNADVFLEVIYDGVELSRTTFKVRELPTFVNGGVSDQFGQPLAGMTVSIPELNRSTVTNGDGGFAFGYQESADKVIPGGRYTLVINPGFKAVKFGSDSKLINLQQGRQNNIGILKLQELNDSSPFQVVSGGTQASLASGELELDLSQAALVFPDGRDLGRVHTQFLPFEHLTVPSIQNIMPMWMFSNQPRGIEVTGEITLSLKIPALGGSYDYLNDAYRYVVLLGYNPDIQVLEPVGIGRIEGKQVISEGPVTMKSFDYFGYALINPQHMPLLEAVAQGEKTLLQLQAELQNLQ